MHSQPEKKEPFIKKMQDHLDFQERLKQQKMERLMKGLQLAYTKEKVTA